MVTKREEFNFKIKGRLAHLLSNVIISKYLSNVISNVSLQYFRISAYRMAASKMNSKNIADTYLQALCMNLYLNMPRDILRK